MAPHAVAPHARKYHVVRPVPPAEAFRDKVFQGGHVVRVLLIPDDYYDPHANAAPVAVRVAVVEFLPQPVSLAGTDGRQGLAPLGSSVSRWR